MQTLDTDRVSLRIAAPALLLYDLVADVTRTPEFSPEIERCVWLDGATGPAVGARFEAVNRAGRRGRSWRNRPVVTAATPGREFAFERTEPFAGTVRWRYEFEPSGGATVVTESYEVTRPIGRVGWFIIEKIFGCPDRRGDLRFGMQRTLERVRVVAEREARDRLSIEGGG
jgi:hypothetical protein